MEVVDDFVDELLGKLSWSTCHGDTQKCGCFAASRSPLFIVWLECSDAAFDFTVSLDQSRSVKCVNTVKQ